MSVQMETDSSSLDVNAVNSSLVVTGTNTKTITLTDNLGEELRVPIEGSDYIGVPSNEKGETNGIHR
jgi:hypothetical protein